MARATPKSSPGTLQQPAASVAQALPGRVHANQDSPRQPRCTFRLRLIRLGALALIGCWLPGLATAASLSEQARARYDEAQKAYAAHPDNPEAGWKLGRACFDLAELATGREERADLAQKGIDSCRHAIAQRPKSAPSHYYLGLNLGQLARTRSFGALKLVDQMEQELIEAARLDSDFDYGGPDRSLGLLYRDAPSIISVGSRSKARDHLSRAVQLAPEYPENRLDLIDSYLKWGDRARARQELTALESILPKAREKFKGAAWASSWSDWETQLRGMKEKLDTGSKLQSPRH